MHTLSFSQLLASINTKSNNTWQCTISDNWLQGRTTYGGLSAAICLTAVENNYPDLPPLRSAQVNFIGPAAGSVEVTTQIMRQGRSVTYISAEMISDASTATHAVFCFGHNRESRLDQDFTTPPTVAGQSDSKDFFRSSMAPAFANNYDCKLAQGDHPISGSEQHEHYIWVRHKDKQANNMAALISIADMPPPAVLPMFKEYAPISSMTWSMNFLKTDTTTQDGWWLMRSAAEHARSGYSSQDMQVWNANRELVITARQNIAIFY